MTPYLVGIAGPSGAGKSVFCRRVLEQCPGVARLKLDDFFCDEADVERHPSGYAYWDHPQSLKWDWLYKALLYAKCGEPCEIPDYSRAENKMVGTKMTEMAPLILIDGYQVLYDERVRGLLDFSLYFDLDEAHQISRRIERQPDVDREYLYRVMLPAAEAFLLPTRRFASAVIDAHPPTEQVFAEAYGFLSGWASRVGMRDVIARKERSD